VRWYAGWHAASSETHAADTPECCILACTGDSTSAAHVASATQLATLLLLLLPQGIDLDAGALVYECPGIKLDPKNIGIGGQDLTPDEPDPLANQAFQLSSLSSASRKVYLDFEGGTVRNTAWNKAYPNINIPAFDMDGKPGEFSVAERNAIVAVWRSVSEDYRCATSV
jgi:hypothetical protein